MGQSLDYLVAIEDAWTGPRYLAGRTIAYQSIGYDPILATLQSEVVRSALERVRGSAQVRILNKLLLGALVSIHARTDRLEGKLLSVTRLMRDEATGVVIFRGKVRQVTRGEVLVAVEATDISEQFDKRLGVVVDASVFTRARPSDVGKAIPIVVGSVEDVVLPVLSSNPSTSLEQDLVGGETEITVSELEDGFPSSGTIIIDEEEMTFASIDTSGDNPILQGVVRQAGNDVPHLRGALVVVKGTFSLGIDGAGLAATLTALRAIDGDKVRYPLLDAFANDSAGGALFAKFSQTPRYRETTGPTSLFVLDHDADVMSTADDVENVLGLDPAFTEAGYALIRPMANHFIKVKRTNAFPLAFRGAIDRVIVRVAHSGNKTGGGPAGQDLSVGSTSVFYDGTQLGLLSPRDTFDTILRQFMGGQARGPVNVEKPTADINATITPTGITAFLNEPGVNEIGTWVDAGDPARTIDSDFSTANPGRVAMRNPTNRGRNEVVVGVVPTNLNPAALLMEVAFVVKHGGDNEANNPVPGGSVLRMQIEQPAGVLLEQVETNDSIPVIEDRVVYDASASGLTIADIPTFVFAFSPLIFVSNPLNTFAIYEVWVEIKATDPNPLQESGSVENHFLVPPALYGATWASLLEKMIEVRGNGNTLEVFRVDVAVLYTPQVFKLPQTFAGDITGFLGGTPADIIPVLWQNAALGNHASSTINLVEFAAAAAKQVAAGIVGASIGGVIRNEGLVEIIHALAYETRLREFYDAGVLRVQYIEDLADLPAPTLTLTKAEIQAPPEPAAVGISIEPLRRKELVNKVQIGYDATDIDGPRGLFEDDVPASITQHGECLLEQSFRFVKDRAVVALFFSVVAERLSEPFERLEFKVNIDLRALDLLQILTLDLGGWFGSDIFEVEQLKENFDETITVKGRVLPAP